MRFLLAGDCMLLTIKLHYESNVNKNIALFICLSTVIQSYSLFLSASETTTTIAPTKHPIIPTDGTNWWPLVTQTMLLVLLFCLFCVMSVYMPMVFKVDNIQKKYYIRGVSEA